MNHDFVDHYATLGLDRGCTTAQVRSAYRLLSKRHHPDVNQGDPEAAERARALNRANEVLGDAARRAAYDRELAAEGGQDHATRPSKIQRNVSQDVLLRIEELYRGTELEIRLNDPSNPDGPETIPLTIPADTAPGTRFRVPRTGVFSGGVVTVRVKVQPSARFKPRGSDLRAELRISAQRAAQGGTEMIPGPSGTMLRVNIPARVGRGEMLRVPGEGLPKSRGGRGDLLVRITYRPEVRVIRTNSGSRY